MEKSPAHFPVTSTADVRNIEAKTPEFLSPTNTSFEGPVKTLEDLRLALLQQFGPEKGKEMYDRFYSSILVMCFGTIHKEMDRSQKAAKRMRSMYKNH